MAARPSDTPNWATGPSALIATPTSATRANGWIPEVKPPAQFFNWWMELVYRWILYLSSGALFDDLAEATEELAIGDLAIVFEDDGDIGPGVETVTKATGISTSTQLVCHVAAPGSLVIVGYGDSEPKAVPRDLDGAEFGGAPLYTYTRAASGVGNEVSKILCDGVSVIVAYGVRVSRYPITGGAATWTYVNGVSTVLDICLAANRVYLVSVETDGTGDSVNNRQCHALNKTTGGVVWSYRHHSGGGVLSSVTTNGRQVFVGGGASDYPSGANMRALRATDGADVDNESGAGTVDDDGLAWNAVHTPLPLTQCMECDGRALYAGFDETSAQQFKVISLADGTVAFGYADPDPTLNVTAIAVDQDYVYVALSDLQALNPEGYVKAFHKGTDAVAWRWGSKAGTADHAACVAIASDGQALFAIAAGTVQKAFKVTRGNVPMHVRKIDPQTDFPHYANWVLQPEAQ
jgi:hypothetical protein